MVMRENAIFTALTTLVEGGLKAMGITDINVMQHAQPIATSDHACVLVSKISMHRYGWQGVQYDKDTGSPKTLKESWDYLEECDFQISAFIPRKETDTEGRLTSYDTISALVTYFNSYQGIMAMKKAGLQPLRISDMQVPVQQDDSASPQFNPNFDIHFIIHQNPSVDVPAIEQIVIKSGGHVPDESPELDEIEKKLEDEKERLEKNAKGIVIDFHHEGIHHV